MAEEAPKYTDSRIFPPTPSKTEFSAQRKSSSSSRLGRFFQKFNGLFKVEAQPLNEGKLSGRIHQLQNDVDALVDDLLSIREELEAEVDSKLPSLISSVVDPLIKEINRVQKAKEFQVSAAQQVKVSTEYSAWIEKAKRWIELCTKRHQQKEAISKAVMEHTIYEFHIRIDRDLQVIQDYLNHAMDSLQANDLIKNELKDKLEPELSHHLFELYLLKDHPPALSVESLQKWRAEADAARESYFSAALHTIDMFAGELNPQQVIEDVGDHHSIEIQVNLASLEEKLIKLEVEIRILDDVDSRDRKKLCRSLLVQLEEEAHHLNSDLRLSHEHIERVQQVLETLSAFKEQLD